MSPMTTASPSDVPMICGVGSKPKTISDRW
jgi:hypothetical protein